MNKTLMLVICDFLLLSMLALARFDPPEEKPEPSLNARAQPASVEKELVALLEDSLQAEQSERSTLAEDLTEARETLSEKARLLAEREEALQETESALQSKATEAQELARERERLAAEKARLEDEKARIASQRESLAQRYETTRETLDKEKEEKVVLTRTLGQLKEASSVSTERLNQTREDLIAREIALAEREAALKEAREEKARLAKEREELNRRLEVAEAEKRLLAQNLTEEQQEKLQLREEKEEAFARAEQLGEGVSRLGEGVTRLGDNVGRLGEGVSAVAEASEEIKQEMEEARPLTMSQIFTRFQNHRGLIRFTSREKGLFGASNERTYDTKSILVDDGETTYLVAHTANTPFAFSKSSGTVTQVSVEITLAGRTFSANQIGFLSTDPRLAFIPLPGPYVEASGLETFELSRQPERWEEAILVKHDESNFGRTEFRRLTASESFLKMDRPALGQLFADFAASRSDLAFTKNGRFIGLLTDTEHAVVVDDFLAGAVLKVGPNFDPAATETTLDRLKDRLRRLPNAVR